MTNDETQDPSVLELFDLGEKRALVTGASGYLGGALARALAEAGATVIVSSRELARAQAVATSLPSKNDARHHAIQMDHDGRDLHRARGFAEALDRAGGLEILVNNGHSHLANDWTERDRLNSSHANWPMPPATSCSPGGMRDHAVERKASASVIMLGSMYGLVGSYPDAYEDICPASPVAYHTLKRRHRPFDAAPGRLLGTGPDPRELPSARVPSLRREFPGKWCKDCAATAPWGGWDYPTS